MFRINYSNSLSAINSFKERDLAKGIVFSSEIVSKCHVFMITCTPNLNSEISQRDYCSSESKHNHICRYSSDI